MIDRVVAIESMCAKLRAGNVSVGSWIQIPHPSVVEIMGGAGYDWIALDLEHGAIAVDQLPDLCSALELGGTLPLARVVQGSIKDCKQALDAGCERTNAQMGTQICVIPFKRDFLLEYTRIEPMSLEIAESVGTMRVLAHGLELRMVPTRHNSLAADTEADRMRVERAMLTDPLYRQLFPG